MMTAYRAPVLQYLTTQQTLELERRIQNWVRWLFSDGCGSGRCASAERMYTAPRDTERSDALVNAADWQSIDAVDAERVQAAYALLSDKARTVVRMHYVKAVEAWRIARAIGVSEASMPDVVAVVLVRLRDQLEAAPVKLIRRGAPIWAGLAPR